MINPLLRFTDISLITPGVSTALLRLLHSSPSPYLTPARLFRIARSCKASLWGDKYPPNELLADMALHRPLELTHQVARIRLRIWNLRSSGEGINDEKDATARSLLNEILQLGEVRETERGAYTRTTHFDFLDVSPCLCPRTQTNFNE